MNVVFWGIVIAALVFLWFCLSFIFKWLGGIGLHLLHDVKEAIKDEKQQTEGEEKKDER